MSEDEILKDIDNYISFANKAENFSDINEYLHCKELARRMKGLLDLYNKEKEKNKELYKDNQKQWGERCRLSIELDNNTISKDKIKAKIKEINNRRIEDGQCELALHGFQREAKIEVLKELLED